MATFVAEATSLKQQLSSLKQQLSSQKQELTSSQQPRSPQCPGISRHWTHLQWSLYCFSSSHLPLLYIYVSLPEFHVYTDGSEAIFPAFVSAHVLTVSQLRLCSLANEAQSANVQAPIIAQTECNEVCCYQYACYLRSGPNLQSKLFSGLSACMQLMCMLQAFTSCMHTLPLSHHEHLSSISLYAALFELFSNWKCQPVCQMLTYLKLIADLLEVGSLSFPELLGHVHLSTGS